ncbi:MAG: GxxExxY protein [Opitutaceae bacterium]
MTQIRPEASHPNPHRDETGATREIIHADISQMIIGSAMQVLNTLRPGLDEKLYGNALVLELSRRGLRVEQQKRFQVSYLGQLIGSLQPDLIVNEVVIVDTKVVSSFNDSHVAQMNGYLAITGLRLALLLNFKTTKLEWKRVVR